MKSHSETNCKLCDKSIKVGDEFEKFSIHGKYHDICGVCYNQIYYKIVDKIIKKIK